MNATMQTVTINDQLYHVESYTGPFADGSYQATLMPMTTNE